MENLKLAEITEKLRVLLGRKIYSIIGDRSALVLLAEILNGASNLPKRLEPHLLTILKCDRDELKNRYPKIRFED